MVLTLHSFHGNCWTTPPTYHYSDYRATADCTGQLPALPPQVYVMFDKIQPAAYIWF
jgi:hypothetical protein